MERVELDTPGDFIDVCSPCLGHPDYEEDMKYVLSDYLTHNYKDADAAKYIGRIARKMGYDGPLSAHKGPLLKSTYSSWNHCWAVTSP